MEESFLPLDSVEECAEYITYYLEDRQANYGGEITKRIEDEVVGILLGCNVIWSVCI